MFYISVKLFKKHSFIKLIRNLKDKEEICTLQDVSQKAMFVKYVYDKYTLRPTFTRY